MIYYNPDEFGRSLLKDVPKRGDVSYSDGTDYKYWRVLPDNSYDEQKAWKKALKNIPIVEVLPADWYDEQEDKVWEDFIKELIEKEKKNREEQEKNPYFFYITANQR